MTTTIRENSAGWPDGLSGLERTASLSTGAVELQLESPPIASHTEDIIQYDDKHGGLLRPIVSFSAQEDKKVLRRLDCVSYAERIR